MQSFLSLCCDMENTTINLIGRDVARGLSLKERRLRGDLLALHSSLNGRAELAES